MWYPSRFCLPPHSSYSTTNFVRNYMYGNNAYSTFIKRRPSHPPTLSGRLSLWPSMTVCSERVGISYNSVHQNSEHNLWNLWNRGSKMLKKNLATQWSVMDCIFDLEESEIQISDAARDFLIIWHLCFLKKKETQITVHINIYIDQAWCV